MDSKSRVNTKQAELLFRIKVFRSALVFVAIAASFFAYNNYFLASAGTKIYAMFELLLAIYSVCLLWLTKDSKYFKLHCNLFLLAFAAIVCYGAATTTFKAGLYVWLFVFPVMSYLLLGSKIGFVTTLVYMLAGVSISLWRLHLSDDSIHPIAIANFSLSFLILWAMSHTYEHQRKKALVQLNKLASTDSLTGLKNRLELLENYAELHTAHRQEKRCFSVAIIDIDHFKVLNDQYGHDTGDQVLIKFAGLLKDNIREDDVAFRVGGEEFCVLLPSANKRQARDILERLRQAVAETAFSYQSNQVSITVSVGLSEYAEDGDNFEKLYQVADERLYHAKETVRNQVVIA